MTGTGLPEKFISIVIVAVILGFCAYFIDTSLGGLSNQESVVAGSYDIPQ